MHNQQEPSFKVMFMASTIQKKILATLGCQFIYAESDSKQKAQDKFKPNPVLTEIPDAKTIDELKQNLIKFSHPLKNTATNLVFNDGNPKASIMFIGEAPGAEEDIKGIPFVGQSGQLLEKIKACVGLDRTNTYIANIIPWRPPANRTPSNDEVATFLPFVHQHIMLINPKIIVTLGGVATKAILNTNSGIMGLRGKFHAYPTNENILVLPMFHPAYLLRSPGQKKQVWFDMLTLRSKI